MERERQLLFLCQGKDCKKSGAKALKKEIKSLLKTTHFKGEFQLVLTKCMDRCKRGPICVLGQEMMKGATINKLQEKMKEANSIDPS